MDNDKILRLAQPTTTTLLAISIFSISIIAKTGHESAATYRKFKCIHH